MSAVLVDDDVNDEYVTFWRECERIGSGHLRWHGAEEFADAASECSWQIENGALPVGWSVQVMCGESWCCSPDHLGLVRIAAVA